MYAKFKAKAEAVSADVRRVTTKAEAVAEIVDVLKAEAVADLPGEWAVWAHCPFLEALDRDGTDRQSLAALVAGLRFDVTREVAAQAKVGISQMQWGIADTGTLGQDSTDVEQRLVSALPIVHIALIAADRFVPDLASFLKVQRPKGAAYISLITGPSRTSDIERVLTIGVHGPERLVIIVVDELSEVCDE
jgi:L-lactate dehydrogenase complex protein LldG